MAFRLPDEYLCLYSVEDVRDYIENFFKVRKGHRCRVRHSVNRKTMRYYDDNNYNQSVRIKTKRFVSINKDNINNELSCGASHFLTHVFDDDIVTNGLTIDNNWKVGESMWKFRNYAKSQYKGINYVVDIDSPRISMENGKFERYDFFDKTIPEYFNQVTELVAKEFDDLEIEYENMFSGNGYYFIPETFYPCEYEKLIDNKSVFESIVSYKELIESRLNKVDEILVKLKNPIQIKAKMEGWNRYYKFPFVFHRYKSRLSIPLSKDNNGNIDVEWLNRATNINNLIKKDENEKGVFIINKGLIQEIIQKANWSMLW